MPSVTLKGEVLSMKTRPSTKASSVVMMDVQAEDGKIYKVRGLLNKGMAVGESITFNYNRYIGTGGRAKKTKYSKYRPIRKLAPTTYKYGR